MTQATSRPSSAPELYAHFARWLREIEAPLREQQQQIDEDEELNDDDRNRLAGQVAQLSTALEAELDGDNLTPEQRRELFALALEKQETDDVADTITDRLIGHALQTDNVMDLAWYQVKLAETNPVDPRIEKLQVVLATVVAPQP